MVMGNKSAIEIAKIINDDKSILDTFSPEEKNALILFLSQEYLNKSEIVNCNNKEKFDTKSEKSNTIFDEPIGAEVSKEIEEVTIINKKAKSLDFINSDKSKKLDTVTIENDLDSKSCSRCGHELKFIGYDESKRVALKSAIIKLLNIKSAKYYCPHCNSYHNLDNNPNDGIITAPTESRILTGSMADSTLVTNLITAKYLEGTPIYRQLQTLKRQGLDVSTGIAAGWCIKTALYLEPLYHLIKTNLIKSNVLFVDETSLKVIDKASTSYVGVAVTSKDEEHQITYYSYLDSRSEECIESNLLEGFKGTIVVDGYKGYKNKEFRNVACCFFHIRKYYYESLLNVAVDKRVIAFAFKPFNLINKMFKFEESIADLSPNDKVKERRITLLPMLVELAKYVFDKKYDDIAKSKFKRAIDYTRQLIKTRKFFTVLFDGRIELSNNRAERAVKLFVIDRKNFLFSKSIDGAKATCISLTLLKSSEFNGLNPEDYLQYVIDILPTIKQSDENLNNYLPWSEGIKERIGIHKNKIDKLLE